MRFRQLCTLLSICVLVLSSPVVADNWVLVPRGGNLYHYVDVDSIFWTTAENTLIPKIVDGKSVEQSLGDGGPVVGYWTITGAKPPAENFYSLSLRYMTPDGKKIFHGWQHYHYDHNGELFNIDVQNRALRGEDFYPPSPSHTRFHDVVKKYLGSPEKTGKIVR